MRRVIKGMSCMRVSIKVGVHNDKYLSTRKGSNVLFVNAATTLGHKNICIKLDMMSPIKCQSFVHKHTRKKSRLGRMWRLYFSIMFEILWSFLHGYRIFPYKTDFFFSYNIQYRTFMIQSDKAIRFQSKHKNTIFTFP